MSTLTRLFEHNAWANARVLAACRKAPPELLEGPGDQSLIRKLRHLFAVEASFPAAINGEPLPTEIPRTLDAIEAFASAGVTGLAALASADEATLARPFRVPWFNREFEAHDGLCQVLSHSGQHRAEIAFELARAGIDSGNLDYIVWIQR